MTAAAPADRRWAIGAGIVCHASFAGAVVAMAGMMGFGMSRSLGHVAPPWNWAADALLVSQFPLLHSWLLTGAGARLMRRLSPRAIAAPMATTTYATIASLQALALFLLWSPSGVVWWRAQGPALVVSCALYFAAWLVLLKAIVDAGFAVQVGLLGWRAVARGVAPVYPPMPRRGLFRFVRQPIYLGFALTVWTVPTWTPDQLALALGLTTYCVAGPLLKESRFRARFGVAFDAYRAATPYFLPIPSRLLVLPRRAGEGTTEGGGGGAPDPEKVAHRLSRGRPLHPFGVALPRFTGRIKSAPGTKRGDKGLGAPNG